VSRQSTHQTTTLTTPFRAHLLEC